MPRALPLVLGITVLAASPAVARAQSLEIDHKAIGCIVVGKYPKMNSCFKPASQLARARVYFRPEGAASWYYVDMKSDQPCFSGILPRPGDKLVGKKIDYYVEAQDRSFNAGRTADYNPIVVRSAQECKKETPAAPFLNNATVAVFPSLPVGFVGGGGIGTAAILGIAGAGAAGAGAVAVLGGEDAPTTTLAGGGGGGNTSTTAPPATTPTTTTTTLPASGGNRPPNAVLFTNPAPPEGLSPLTVTFDLCKSTDPDGDPLSFYFDFGDGTKTSGSCSQTHTYTVTPLRARSAVERSFNVEACAVDPGGLSQCRARTPIARLPEPDPVTTTTTTTTTLPPCGAPTITIDSPRSLQCFGTPSIPVSATASLAIRVNFAADFTGVSCTFPPIADVAFISVPGFGPTYSGTLDVSARGDGCYTIRANAVGCSTDPRRGGIVTDATPVPSVLVNTPPGCLTIPLRRPSDTSGLGWASDLGLGGGRLQVVVNGGSAAFAGDGRTYGTSGLAAGENRVEATVVAAPGKPGLWRFEALGSQVVPGSIRVIGGEALAVAGTSVTFRLRGTPGERLVFTFTRR